MHCLCKHPLVLNLPVRCCLPLSLVKVLYVSCCPWCVCQVVSAGGLLVLGTSLQEGERIELQLRGRAGRQGDPGTTQLMFDISDPLITNYGMQSEWHRGRGTGAVIGLWLQCLWMPAGCQKVVQDVVRPAAAARHCA